MRSPRLSCAPEVAESWPMCIGRLIIWVPAVSARCLSDGRDRRSRGHNSDGQITATSHERSRCFGPLRPRMVDDGEYDCTPNAKGKIQTCQKCNTHRSRYSNLAFFILHFALLHDYKCATSNRGLPLRDLGPRADLRRSHLFPASLRDHESLPLEASPLHEYFDENNCPHWCDYR